MTFCDRPEIFDKSREKNHGKKENRPGAMIELLALQRDMVDSALKAEPRDKAALARAWVDLEKLRMAKRGKPTVISAQTTGIVQIARRKFGLVRSVDAQVVDIGPAEKPEPAPAIDEPKAQ